MMPGGLGPLSVRSLTSQNTQTASSSASKSGVCETVAEITKWWHFSKIYIPCMKFASNRLNKQNKCADCYTVLIFGSIVFVFHRWDNGENEKLSPWDLEPIVDEGNNVLARAILRTNFWELIIVWFGAKFVCLTAQEPETEGGGIPVTAEEMKELMYKPLAGEWGERSRDEECERIIAGIDQLITVGVFTDKILFVYCQILFHHLLT